MLTRKKHHSIEIPFSVWKVFKNSQNKSTKDSLYIFSRFFFYLVYLFIYFALYFSFDVLEKYRKRCIPAYQKTNTNIHIYHPWALASASPVALMEIKYSHFSRAVFHSTLWHELFFIYCFGKKCMSLYFLRNKREKTIFVPGMLSLCSVVVVVFSIKNVENIRCCLSHICIYVHRFFYFAALFSVE